LRLATVFVWLLTFVYFFDMFIINEQSTIIYNLKDIITMKTEEQEILQKALLEVQNAANLKIEVQDGNHGFDATLRVGQDKKKLNFAVEIKKRVAPPALGAFIQKQRALQKNRKALLVTRHATPLLADQMKKMGIQFIDTAGNAYINAPPLFVFIKGNKPIDIQQVERPTRAFGPKGLRVVFALLCNPGLEDEPFRKIAKVAGTALGTVDWVIRDLKGIGYLVDAGKQVRRLIRKKELLARWVTMYPEQLRPRILEGRYRAPDTEWWKGANLKNFAAFWGGEVAAAKMTDYLKPMIVTIYIKERPAGLLLKHKIIKDPNGNIELLKTFWDFENDRQFPNLVHPILIYADLMATGDTRNIETAGMIYEKKLTRFIQEE
jgi:hypothetical protein